MSIYNVILSVFSSLITNHIFAVNISFLFLNEKQINSDDNEYQN